MSTIQYYVFNSYLLHVVVLILPKKLNEQLLNGFELVGIVI